MQWMIIIGVVAIIFLLVWVVDLTWKRKARRHMAGRPCQSSLEFGKEFYPDQESVAASIRDILAKHIAVDISQIEPSNQFARDLHMDDLDSMASVECGMALEEHFGIKIQDADAQRMRSVDDLVRYVIEKVNQTKMDSNGI